MCRVNRPGEVIRPLVIEVFNNGKVSIVPDTMEGSELTIDELAACRDLIDLIIANPKNFHIVKTDPPVKEINICNHIKMPVCRECKNELTNNTELETGICFNCERKRIIQEADNRAIVNPLHTADNQGRRSVGKLKHPLVKPLPEPVVDDLDKVMDNEPGYHIDAQADITEPAPPEPIGELIPVCEYPGCVTVLKSHIAKRRRTCFDHKDFTIVE